jgi:GntR family transcriptional regulator
MLLCLEYNFAAVKPALRSPARMPKPARPLRDPDVPLHRQLFLVVRDDIARGVYPAEAALPTEQALGETFGVSRITVRRALRELADAGLVEARQGRGTFVRPAAAAPAPHLVLDHLAEMKKAHLETQVELLELATRKPPPAVRDALGLTADDDALDVLRLRRHGRQPLVVTESWLPMRFAAAVSRAALRDRALHELMLATGVRFGRVIQDVSAERADPRVAAWLDTEIGAPILRLIRLVHDRRGQPIQYLVVRLSPERSRLVMEISSGDADALGAGYVAHDVAPSR